MDTLGNVFDIQRASLHDGPGIRTTVFLKGCPLRCLWCHNPEAGEFNPQLYFYAERCVACGECMQACESGVHHFDQGMHMVDIERCDACGICVEACNHQALKIVGQPMAVEEVMQAVLSDRKFYERSGGGLTLSGGEPMAQFPFTRGLLRAAHQEGIHTCIETSGYSSPKRYEEILPDLDLILFDYKITGSREHKRYTGVTNELILANLDYLYRQGKSIILRCPIIPDINDTRLHFRAIAELDENYPGFAGIEILPYHNMGNNKRLAIGWQTGLDDLPTTSPETAAEWLDQLHNLGCVKATIG